jgi:hypothetical protein
MAWGSRCPDVHEALLELFQATADPIAEVVVVEYLVAMAQEESHKWPAVQPSGWLVR